MQHDQKQLHELAQKNPNYMFSVEEIAELCNVSRDVVSRVRAASDSPFFLNKCRPEWFLEWMRKHPEFQLTKASLVANGQASAEEDEIGSSPGGLPMCGFGKKKSSAKRPTNTRG